MESFRDAYCLAEENGVWAGRISMEEADSSLPGVGLFGSGELSFLWPVASKTNSGKRNSWR